MKKGIRVDSIGYKNIYIICSEEIRGFGIVATDENGKERQQEMRFRKGKNVIQMPEDKVDDFLFALRGYADDKVKSIKILDFKNGK